MFQIYTLSEYPSHILLRNVSNLYLHNNLLYIWVTHWKQSNFQNDNAFQQGYSKSRAQL